MIHMLNDEEQNILITYWLQIPVNETHLVCIVYRGKDLPEKWTCLTFLNDAKILHNRMIVSTFHSPYNEAFFAYNVVKNFTSRAILKYAIRQEGGLVMFLFVQ